MRLCGSGLQRHEARGDHVFRTEDVGQHGFVQQLLLADDVGLLTLTGPGGIGKTRLALQAAANLLDQFVDGVFFVALAALGDPTLVLPAIAQVLGVRETSVQPLVASVEEYLRDRQLLLVLDNFEQLLPAPRPRRAWSRA